MEDLLVLRQTARYSSWCKLTLREAGLRVLNEASPQNKARLSHLYAQAWHRGEISIVSDEYSLQLVCPPEPARPQAVLEHHQDKAREEELKRMVKKTTIEYTIHGICNAESYAIDLFWDLVVRFTSEAQALRAPKAFFDDMMFIVEQEANHFCSWLARLETSKEQGGYGIEFGHMPFYNGLWDSATDTKDDLCARLAIINLTHEAKGLDTYPKTRDKFVSANDKQSISTLDANFKEEIGHVRLGKKWFVFFCMQKGICSSGSSSSNSSISSNGIEEDDQAIIKEFHSLSNRYFKGSLKPPFNTKARDEAGLTQAWYLPLVASA